MSDMADFYRAWREEKRALQIECPECKRLRPKMNASKLLPGQKCRVDGYKDRRTVEESKT